LSIFTASAARDVTVASAVRPVNAPWPSHGGAGSKRAKPVGRGSALGLIDRAGSVVVGGELVVVVVVVVVELVVDGAVVVATTIVVDAADVDVASVGGGAPMLVDGGGAVAGDVVVLVGELAAASLQAEASNSVASKEFGKVRLRPAMAGDHTDTTGPPG
jgi:hypothetical protein